MRIGRDSLEQLRKDYPPGTTVILDRCIDPYEVMQEGMSGIVRFVDDEGTLFVRWENGSGLGLVYGEDQYHKKEVCEETVK